MGTNHGHIVIKLKKKIVLGVRASVCMCLCVHACVCVVCVCVCVCPCTCVCTHILRACVLVCLRHNMQTTLNYKNNFTSVHACTQDVFTLNCSLMSKHACCVFLQQSDHMILFCFVQHGFWHTGSDVAKH